MRLLSAYGVKAFINQVHESMELLVEESMDANLRLACWSDFCISENCNYWSVCMVHKASAKSAFFIV